MNYKVGKSSNHDLNGAISEATSGFMSPKLILFYSDIKHFKDYTVLLKERYANSIVMGATTFAGFCKD